MSAAGPGAPVGVVLAGGAGRRLGGAKPATPLAGRPLISYPLAALRAVLAPVAVVAKHGSPLPPVGYGVELWREPDEPVHPLCGITEALRRADGRAVVVLACDLPLVTAAVVRELAHAPAGDALAVVATADGELQPLCARYEPAALEALAGFDDRGRLMAQVAALEPVCLPVDPGLLLNVNDPAGLAAAEAALAG